LYLHQTQLEHQDVPEAQAMSSGAVKILTAHIKQHLCKSIANI